MNNIKNYLELLGLDDNDKLDFIIEETIERALNYMNRTELPQELERVIARAIYNAERKYTAEAEGHNQRISSVSDNGQSVSYKDSVISFMSTQTDEEVFEGITSQLKRFRILRVLNETTE